MHSRVWYHNPVYSESMTEFQFNLVNVDELHPELHEQRRSMFLVLLYLVVLWAASERARLYSV